MAEPQTGSQESGGKGEAARFRRAVLRAGLTAGALDITAAFVTWAPQGVSPIRILQGISSGLLGARSFQAGWSTVALGLFFQFFIATSAALVFALTSRRFPVLTLRPIVCGALYGIAVYLVMYWVVMPLSRFHRRPFSASAAAIAIATHIVCVGIPISLVIRRQLWERTIIEDAKLPSKPAERG